MLFLSVLLIAWATNISLNVYGWCTRSTTKDIPLDGGMHFVDGVRVLGASTTIGGLVLCVLAALLLVPFPPLWSVPLLVYGGHALGSFIKRRCKYKDGAFLPGIDHGDYALLIGVVFVPLGYLSLSEGVWFYILSISITPVITWLGYACGVRKDTL